MREIFCIPLYITLCSLILSKFHTARQLEIRSRLPRNACIGYSRYSSLHISRVYHHRVIKEREKRIIKECGKESAFLTCVRPTYYPPIRVYPIICRRELIIRVWRFTEANLNAVTRVFPLTVKIEKNKRLETHFCQLSTTFGTHDRHE